MSLPHGLLAPTLPAASGEPTLSPPVLDLIDLIAPDGTLRWANGAQAEALGYDENALPGMALDTLYQPDSATWLRELLANPCRTTLPTEVALRCRDGRALRVLATPLPRATASEGLTLRKRPLGALATRLSRLETENRLLRRIADAGNEAHWCIEFALPIDTRLPVDDIVYRVFSHPSYWRLCNQAMSRLYGLPHHLDLCDQGVRTYWPRSPENEAFVRQIIAAGYSIDGALSVDNRHDGRRIRVENDVRADLEDGYLVRLWGNCRPLDAAPGDAP